MHLSENASSFDNGPARPHDSAPAGAEPPSRATAVVRDACEADMESVSRICAHYVLNAHLTFEEVPPTPADFEKKRRAILSLGLPFLVAEREGSVLGFSYAGAYRPRPAYRYTVENSIYIAPDCRRQGLGTLLLDNLISRCEKGPFRQMIAVVGGTDNIASLELHSRFGFVHAGTLRAVGYKFGHWVDTVLLQRALSEGCSSDPGAKLG